MPLRDHFRAPLDDEASWEGFHGQWPAMIVIDLARRLPPGYVAAPRVHSGAFVEIDVATYGKDCPDVPAGLRDSNGGVATAVWAPPRATLAVSADLPAQDEYEVRIYDRRRGRRLVAAVEIVSPVVSAPCRLVRQVPESCERDEKGEARRSRPLTACWQERKSSRRGPETYSPAAQGGRGLSVSQAGFAPREQD